MCSKWRTEELPVLVSGYRSITQSMEQYYDIARSYYPMIIFTPLREKDRIEELSTQTSCTREHCAYTFLLRPVIFPRREFGAT